MKKGESQGGDTLFFCIRRLGPSIYHSPPKHIKNFKHPKKIFEILATQKNIPQSVHWPNEKTLKCIEMTPKYSPFLMTQKNIQINFHTPKNIIFFKTPPPPPKKNWNSTTWTQKNDPWGWILFLSIRKAIKKLPGPESTLPFTPWNSNSRFLTLSPF